MTDIHYIDVKYEKGCADAILTVPLILLFGGEVYWTWDSASPRNFATMIDSATLDVESDCGALEVTWAMDSNGDLTSELLDTSVFTVVSSEDVEIYTEDETKVGTYSLLFRMSLVDYPLVISSPDTEALSVVIKDRCTAEGGLMFTLSESSYQPIYYFYGDVK